MVGENATELKPVGRVSQLFANLDGRPRLARLTELVVAVVVVAMALATYGVISNEGQQRDLMTPALVAALLIANLVPAMALLVLLGRRIAMRRATDPQVGGQGRLHVRLVALFSVIAAVPTLLVAIFASLLFQYGVDFWFSDRSRGMFENAASLATGFYEQSRSEVSANTLAMAGDLRATLSETPIESPSFDDYYVQQVVVRNLQESVIVEIGDDGIARTLAAIDPNDPDEDDRITPAIVRRLQGGEDIVLVQEPGRVAAATLISNDGPVVLYAARAFGYNQIESANAVLADYNSLFARSRQLQLRFNLAIYLVSLVLVGLAVWAALLVADRLVRPVTALVSAARRVAAGDLGARVDAVEERDEIGTLSNAFNSMTEQLQAKTGELLDANAQIDRRRALTEAVLSGVSAGVLSIARDGTIRILNRSAQELLGTSYDEAVGAKLSTLCPELADVVTSGEHRAVVKLGAGGDERTLAVRVAGDRHGHVVTFEDITQQLIDQRRAAWSDVARRIAHEIKNPLTPIQLAAERLQRRYGKSIAADDNGTFRKLTDTIVRQVGDLRRMVDEFSSFARMPKPVFHTENLVDIVRQAVFLHEVAHPEIDFTLATPDSLGPVVCDRRQLTQALTNIVKNAVEAIHRRDRSATDARNHIAVSIALDKAPDERGPAIAISVADTGAGLPEQRETIAEPYVTMRSGGTGLGLAIVTKIVEEHFGEISFADRPGGGAIVTITLFPEVLEPIATEQETYLAADDELPHITSETTRNGA